MSNTGVEVAVNGQTRTIRAGLTIAGLLEELGVAPERVAIELNREIVRRAQWAEREIEAGASIEIVQFVGGG